MVAYNTDVSATVTPVGDSSGGSTTSTVAVLVTASPAPLTPLLWAGQYQDPTSGLYYMQARWYDPGTGQFMSVDPDLVDTNQPYSYAGDDPVNEEDPSGRTTLGLCGSFNLSLLIFSGSVTGCLTRIVTGYGPFRYNKIALVVSPAVAFGPGIGYSGGLLYDISNADALPELGGPFVYVELDADIGVGVGIIVYFTPPGTGTPGPFIWGVEFGVEFGADLSVHVGLNDTTVQGLGVFRGVADVAFDTAAEPATYLADFVAEGAQWLAEAEVKYSVWEASQGEPACPVT